MPQDQSADETGQNNQIPDDKITPAVVITNAPFPVIKKPLTIENSWSDDVSRLLSQNVNLSENNVYHEPTCPLCSSPLRDEAEEIWNEGSSADKDKQKEREKNIIDVFMAKSGEKISRAIIINHMKFHMNCGVRAIQAREYIGRIQRLNNTNTSTMNQIDIGMTMLIERIAAVNSLTPSPELSQAEVEKIKSAETAKLMSQWQGLLKLKAQIMGELKNSGDMVSIPTREFSMIFEDAFLHCSNDDERALINGILDKLKTLVRC